MKPGCQQSPLSGPLGIEIRTPIRNVEGIGKDPAEADQGRFEGRVGWFAGLAPRIECVLGRELAIAPQDERLTAVGDPIDVHFLDTLLIPLP